MNKAESRQSNKQLRKVVLKDYMKISRGGTRAQEKADLYSLDFY